MKRERLIPREPEDPMPPSNPIADGLLLMGSPGEGGLKIGEYVDGSGGLDLALLDESWVFPIFFLSLSYARNQCAHNLQRTRALNSNGMLGGSKSMKRTRRSRNKGDRRSSARIGSPACAS